MAARAKVSSKNKPASADRAARRAKPDTTESQGEVFVVGVGASAGGLQALQAFFGAVAESLNAAFVVVQHLSPDFKSFMVELLAKHTRMAVQRAEHGVAVRPGNVYLIPPKVTLTISRGRLQLVKSDPRRGLHLPIDEFFISLARDQQRRAVAIVLSGTGSDGTAGIRAVKDAGGMVMVQSEDSAQFDGMPRSAIATGLADFVLPPEKMPEQLARYLSHPLLAPNHATTRERGNIEATLGEIFTLLRSQTGVDFSHYKPATIDRRIERRMSVCQITELADYARHLGESSREISLLFDELLIGVTSFFRDAKAWQTLEKEVIPALLKAIPPGEPLRAWVAGCSTGEEAYTLAILFAEAMDRLKLHPQVKIFATDISKSALGVAARGHYSPSEVAGLTPERLDQFFVKESNGHRVRTRLREMVVFANHNLLSDPPFTKLSLVSCRNLLIYLSSTMQQRLLTLFSFALREDGVLFLGGSESIGDATDRFQPIATRANLYRNRRIGAPPPMLSNPARIARPRPPAIDPSPAIQRAAARASAGDVPALETVHRQIVAEFAPACLVIDGRDDVVHILGSAGDYLKLGEGGITRNIFKLTQHNLANALRSALIRAQQKGDRFTYDNVRYTEGRKTKVVRLHVRPMLDRQGKLTGTRLIFIEQVKAAPASPAGRSSRQNSADSRHIADLERDLSLTRESLQATVQDLETSNEEIQAANEELLAANEELQSTNEELQSVNEELHTVNVENQSRIEDTTRLNNDLNNLLATASVGVLLVDSELRVRRASNSALQLLDLTDSYLGIPIETIARILHAPDLPAKVQHVMAQGHSEEFEVRRADSRRWTLLRCVPFRNETGRTQGAVVTLIDITERHRSQERSTAQTELIKTVLDAMDSGTVVLNRHGEVLLVNRHWASMVAAAGHPTLANLQVGGNFFDLAQRSSAPSGFAAPATLQGLRKALRRERESFSTDYAVGPADAPSGRRWYRITASPLSAPEEGLVVTHFSLTAAQPHE